MFAKWVPWKYLVRRLAHAHGFLDPLAILSRLEGFAQPSEVSIPMELLRAGAVFHARGLLNARAIQSNLDWIWPYWIDRQFDPTDPSFLPRGFAITHVNLTHRNWTAVGQPDCNAYPIVDPRGLLTPFFDGWSLDAWIVTESGQALFPSRLPQVEQQLHFWNDNLVVETKAGHDGNWIRSRAEVSLDGGAPQCLWQCTGAATENAYLAIVLRPFNPEGISLVKDVELSPARDRWQVDGLDCVALSQPCDRHCISCYHHGDVARNVLERPDQRHGRCDVGMVTAAALYHLPGGKERAISVKMPLLMDAESAPVLPKGKTQSWTEALSGTCQLQLPDPWMQTLYETAVRNLVLHAPLDVYPGPYTYKRFWFRDAALMVHAMLLVGLDQRAGLVCDRFFKRQDRSGYFHSQEGEWDANGQVLWILERAAQCFGIEPKPAWRRGIIAGAHWLEKKRGDDPGTLHHGLLPAGFSAEHLGNNDYYYWDDFWAVAGLQAAARCCGRWQQPALAAQFAATAAAYQTAIAASLQQSCAIRHHQGMPASPYRRMDAGAIGSICCSYPLALRPPDDTSVRATVDYLLTHCFVKGAFFQDMIHSGLNAYLSLHVAQCLLRMGDGRFAPIVSRVAELASPTGQWPEAIHPHTLGGCMGDGQHIWAAAEWLVMLRNMIVREEGAKLWLCSGLLPVWFKDGASIHFGPAPTAWGPVTVDLHLKKDTAALHLQGAWRQQPPVVCIGPWARTLACPGNGVEIDLPWSALLRREGA